MKHSEKAKTLTRIPRIFANWEPAFLIRVNSRNSRLALLILLAFQLFSFQHLAQAQPNFLPFYTSAPSGGGGGGGGATNIIGNVLNYELNGSSSVTATDTSGNGNDATLVGSPVQGAGIITWVAATPTFGFSPAQQWPQTACTFTFWIHMTDPTAAYYFPQSRSAGNCYSQCFSGSSTIGFRIMQVQDISYIGRSTGAILTSGWHFIAVTWGGGTSSSSIKIFFDGVQSDTTDDNLGTFTAPYAGSDTRFSMGGGIGSGGSLTVPEAPFDGSMSRVKVFSRVLTTGEIANLNTLGH